MQRGFEARDNFFFFFFFPGLPGKLLLPSALGLPYVCVPVPTEARRGRWLPGAGVIGSCELPKKANEI